MNRAVTGIRATIGVLCLSTLPITPALASEHVLGGRLVIFAARAENPPEGGLTDDLEVKVLLQRSIEGPILGCIAPDDAKLGVYAAKSCAIAQRLSPAFLGRRKATKLAVTVIWSAGDGNPAQDDGASYVYLPNSITPLDYPQVSADRRESGMVRMRLTVDVSGMPIGCAVIESSGFDALDDRSCRVVLTKVRFIAPLDDHGQPRISHPIRRMTWGANL